MPPRRNPTTDVSVWPVKLHLDDLIEIDSVVRSIAKAAVILAVEDYRLDSISELCELRKPNPRSIRWVSVQPDLAVHLSHVGANVVATGGDPQLRGAAEQIADVLRHRRRPGYRLFAMSWLPAVCAVVGSMVLSFARSPLWVLGEVVAGAWALTSGRARLARRAVLFSSRKEDRPSFWERKRDDLLLLVLGVAIGAVPTGVITYLTTRK